MLEYTWSQSQYNWTKSSFWFIRNFKNYLKIMLLIISFRKQLCQHKHLSAKIIITLKTSTSIHSVACIYFNHRYRSSHVLKCLGIGFIRLLSCSVLWGFYINRHLWALFIYITHLNKTIIYSRCTLQCLQNIQQKYFKEPLLHWKKPS